MSKEKVVLVVAVPRGGLREPRGTAQGAARTARGHEDVADLPGEFHFNFIQLKV